MSIKRSLKARMLALIGGSLLAILLISVACFHFLAGNVRDYRALVDGPVRTSQLVEQANLQFKIQVQEWKNVLLRGKQPADLDKYWSQFEARHRDVQNLLGQLAAQPGLAAEAKGQIDQLREGHQALLAQYARGRDTFVAGGADPIAGDKSVTGIDRAISDQMSALAKRIAEDAKAQAEGISATAERTVWLGFSVLLASGVLIALLSLWLVSRQLVQPITQLIGYVDDLSKGRFAERVSSDREDELGRLANAANTLRDFLAETFTRLKRNATELDGASSELHQIARQMAQGSEEQFQRTDQVATAMTEMSATAQEVARHAQDAAQAADDADASARQGDRVMKTTIGAIDHMRREIETTAEVIRKLENDSGRVGKVLEVIRGIAEQTNLLALNAAIEAARAGEAGRGFAVVADEVRSLAQRTSSSISEINQIIDAVQLGTTDAAKAIESGQARSSESAEHINRTSEILHQVSEAIEAIRGMNRQIATAAEEQTSVAEDIAQNLTEITAIASENQQSVQRTEQASGNLNRLSGQMSELTARLGG
ncbi:methyl-accepting chemotaxis protein [Pseudomonas sp. KNUC1026]|nr:methyl-accepting chemotaxis protein [Pseudomonas sp. KNUC1026]UFH48774.1 methyl-accepting chemotaxis protein [Pseudomonas sp. KNUC1026]